MTSMKIDSAKLNALLQKVREEKKLAEEQINKEIGEFSTSLPAIQPFNIDLPYTTKDKYGNTIEYNYQQKRAIKYALDGQEFILIGAAGTGKTTTMRGVLQELIQNNLAGILDSAGHKYLPSNVPGIIICAFTKIAVNNIRRNLSKDLADNCLTIHKLLEYEPVYYDVTDPKSGEMRKKMIFEPGRDAALPLPSTIKYIVIEEASMLGLDLWQKLRAATPSHVKFIFLGDIQQLPPVFGPAILGFKLNELPVIELTEVYRQALESPIIRLAHRILSGVPIEIETNEKGEKGFYSFNEVDKLTLHPWKKKIPAENALNSSALFFNAAYDAGRYNPEEDIILIPYNKQFGTIELNKKIANYIARKLNRTTYEIVAGFMTHYFSIGDKVLFDKEAAIITKIEPTVGYTGKSTAPESKTLDYWGYDSALRGAREEDLLDSFTLSNSGDEDEERTRKSSHKVTLFLLNSDTEYTIQTVGEFNNLSLAYALTVHKSQGSEWKKVFVLFHQSHAKMLQRELLYTAVTRAREELYVICEPESFFNGIKSQKVKGNTLAEKAEFFKGKIKSGDYSEEEVG